MRISKVAEATGLTKKAIKHYEAEGLIRPASDPQTGYREFDEDDVVRLELIHTLRMLDVSVAEIRRLLAGEAAIGDALRQALQRTNTQIERLAEGRLILASLVERGVADTALLREDVRRLRQAVELSREGRRLHLADAVQRVFPGSFGRFMVLLHAPFFDIDLDTEEQRARWLRFVAYLDDLDEPPHDHPFFSLARVEDEAAVEAFLDGQSEHVARLLREEPGAIAELRDATVQFVRSLKEDPGARQRHAERLAASQDLWDSVGGPGDDAFNEHLAALNDDYRRYLAIGQRIREEAEREVGYDLARQGGEP